jgi:eukaryotic-like serine/threonine-protein kinase
MTDPLQIHSQASADTRETDVHADVPGTGQAATSVTPVERYELLSEIAHGGMGVVYRATDSALAREVAVKVLQDKFGTDSGAARRFADEARIAAQLQHPGIPPVHDLGALPDGRPFLAMKLIKGQTLEELLAARPDPAAERSRFVAVFEQVCQAVAYAHAHHVIHRDLKPANVMVGAFGEVQVMDWGLAKVLKERDAGGTRTDDPDAQATTGSTEMRPLRNSDAVYTQAGSVLGTPAFLAPEQAIGAIDQVDAQSDVFGLGGVLAAILTGQPPFQADTAESARQLAARGKVQKCFARMDACGADPELVALCKSCLSPEKRDRPANAAEVARAVAALRAAADERARRAELERVRLEGEQAIAVAQTLERRKRRRLWLGAAAALVLAALGGLGAVLVVQRQANALLTHKNQELDLAAAAEKTAKEMAETRESETRAVLDFVEKRVFAAARPKDQQGGMGYNVQLADALQAALPFVETGFQEKPLIEARLRLTLGHSFYLLGKTKIAADQYQKAWSLYSAERGRDDPDSLLSMNGLANSYEVLDRHAEALKLREELLALRKVRLGPDHPETLKAMINLGNSYGNLGREADALKLREETLALHKTKVGPDHPDTLRAMLNLSNSYENLGRNAEALKLREETLPLMKVKIGPDHPDTLVTMANLGFSYQVLGRHAEAAKLLEETAAFMKAKLGLDHPSTLYLMKGLADSYSALGRNGEAQKLLEETLALMNAKLGPNHHITLDCMSALGLCYAELGRHAEAAKLHEQTLAGRKIKLGPDHADTISSMHALAMSYDALGRHAEGVHLHEEAAAACEKLKRTDGQSLYNAARYRAGLAASIRAGDKSGTEMKPVTAEADRAMSWLRQAVAAGYEGVATMKTDRDLDVLRDREDFKKLLAELEAKTKSEAK